MRLKLLLLWVFSARRRLIGFQTGQWDVGYVTADSNSSYAERFPVSKMLVAALPAAV